MNEKLFARDLHGFPLARLGDAFADSCWHGFGKGTASAAPPKHRTMRVLAPEGIADPIGDGNHMTTYAPGVPRFPAALWNERPSLCI
jgi:hypothetical protein